MDVLGSTPLYLAKRGNDHTEVAMLLEAAGGRGQQQSECKQQ